MTGVANMGVTWVWQENFFVSIVTIGDAQSPLMPRPRYVTSHSQIGHKCWDIVILQQLHRFPPFIL